MKLSREHDTTGREYNSAPRTVEVQRSPGGAVLAGIVYSDSSPDDIGHSSPPRPA